MENKVFVQSTIDKVQGGTGTISVGDVGKEQLKQLTKYPSFNNYPINLNHVAYFKPDTERYRTGIELPCIKFFQVDSSIIVAWMYPPTKDGTIQRDDDLYRLCDNYCD